MSARSKLESTHTNFPGDWTLLKTKGANKFTTLANFRTSEGENKIWESRRHRKERGLEQTQQRGDRLKQTNPLKYVSPQKLSWWVAIGFIVGSALFTLGALAALSPSWFAGLDFNLVDWAYFSGAIAFTIAIYLQILETINADENAYLKDVPRQNFYLWKWQFDRLSYVSTLILFIGSLMFNVETTCVLLGITNSFLLVSLPSLLGSIAFVIYGYLGAVEVCHQWWGWKPRRFSWWVQVFNFVGAIGFLVAAIFGFDLPGFSSPDAPLVVQISHFLGSILFLAGSALMLPELYSE